MATVSPNYSRDGENYEQLQAKLKGLFQTYAQIDFSTQRLRIKPSGAKAKAEADYLITLTPFVGSPIKLSGKLFLTLIESEGRWQIIRIDTRE